MDERRAQTITGALLSAGGSRERCPTLAWRELWHRLDNATMGY